MGESYNNYYKIRFIDDGELKLNLWQLLFVILRINFIGLLDSTVCNSCTIYIRNVCKDLSIFLGERYIM